MRACIQAIAFLSCAFTGYSSLACLEPKFCKCLAGCGVFDKWAPEGATYLPCDFNLLAVPNFKIFFDAGVIKEQITWAKEKLTYEAGKTYEGPWKDHVINTKKGGVVAMQGLLGIQFSLVKATYGAKIQERLVSLPPKGRCEIAKCMAFCSNSCESQCDTVLDSTDESYLTEISWTKDMCDLEATKTAIKDQCTGIKDGSEGCDANCDSAYQSFSLMLVVLLSALSLRLF